MTIIRRRTGWYHRQHFFDCGGDADMENLLCLSNDATRTQRRRLVRHPFRLTIGGDRIARNRAIRVFLCRIRTLSAAYPFDSLTGLNEMNTAGSLGSELDCRARGIISPVTNVATFLASYRKSVHQR
jgi:hypothetical protein